MRSTAKIDLDALRAFIQWLEENGFEVSVDRDGYRALMYRKRYRPWTQGWSGANRTFIRFAGPESEAVHVFSARRN